MRPLTRQERESIKAATEAGCQALGGISAAARALDVSSSTLTKYVSTSAEWSKNFIRLDLAVRMDRLNAHAFLLSTMTTLVDEARPAVSEAVTAAAILRLDGVLDDVVREVANAIEDGRIDAAERRAIRNRIVAAKQYLARLDLMMGG